MKLAFENRSIGLESEWLPTAYIDSAENLTADSFADIGLEVDVLAADVDGTLMNYHESELPEWAENMFRGFGERGIRSAIISNAYDDRVDELREIFSFDPSIGIYAPASVTPDGENPKKYRKPNPAMLERIAEDYGVTDRRRIAVLGDQAMKDTRVANKWGATSVLTDRLGNNDDPRVKYLQRPFVEGPSRILHTGVQLSDGKIRRVGTPVRTGNFPSQLTLTRPPADYDYDQVA